MSLKYAPPSLITFNLTSWLNYNSDLLESQSPLSSIIYTATTLILSIA